MKCKKQQVVKDGTIVTMKNGRKALKGKCSVCGTAVLQDAGANSLTCEQKTLCATTRFFFW